MKIQPQQYICDLSPYQPGMPIEQVVRERGLDPAMVVKLASNENPLGMSPKAKSALMQAIPDAHRYPEQHGLIQKLADRLTIEPAMIVLGNGSNDVLDLIARTYLNDGDEAISSQYAFAIYQIATQSCGATNVVVPSKNYGHDLGAMLRAVTPKTRVIWIANPNNPTGTFIPYGEIKEFLDQVPKGVIVVLDEAYYEYLSPEDRVDSLRWLADYPNLIITRTFSKIYGLAGLRIGYGGMSTEIASLLNRVRQPFNVNVLALAAATAALDDTGFIAESARVNTAGRIELLEGLTKLDCECLPAYGNFVTFQVKDAAKVNEALLNQGVIVRPLGGYGMPDWLRVTIGTAAENERFLQALSTAPTN